ncbi:hypothetical protein ACIGZJ_31175 [Kitasatospora sp. NPDC052868]|uniref:hypothetical protein n=1 Tax=Kitasatospora sp. NPDC052868 TaxID=3364060 RepID=UPI0037C5BB93
MATEDTPADTGTDAPPAEAPAAPTAAASTPVTVESALANAARLLGFAENETNLALMERYEALADSWNSLARTVIADRD